jgi:hypothetical protein
MARQSKKERRRLKRKRRHKETIRLRQASPYEKIGQAGRVERCAINDDWSERGQAIVYVLCQAPGRPPAMGAFLVDLWCAGLKDAWGRLEFSRQDFRDLVEKSSRGMDLDFVEADLDEVRALIAASIRFARRNGFRLPPRYERWLAVVGGVGDIDDADLSDFGRKGKLCWVGPEEDLRRRLIGSTVQEFLARDDVEYIVGLEELPPSFEAVEAVEASVQGMHDNMLDAVRRWCFANAELPHPRLGDAMDLMTESILQMAGAADLEAPPDDGDADEALENIERLLALEGPADAVELARALDQARRFLGTFRSARDMMAALGLAVYDEGE